MTPFEIMLSESQARLLLVLESGKEEKAKKIFDKWNLDFAVIGKTTNTKNIELYFDNKQVAKHIKNDTITEEVELVDGKLPKGVYKLSNDIIKDDDEDIPLLKKDDDVETLEDTLPSDTVLGVPVFAVLHTNSNSKIFVSMDDIEPVSVEDALGEI